MSAQSLRAYALALMPFMLVKVLAPGYFSRQDMTTPVRIAVIAMTANMVFNLILVWPLAHAGLALATALSAWMNASLLLLRGLYREGVFRPLSGWGRFGAVADGKRRHGCHALVPRLAGKKLAWFLTGRTAFGDGAAGDRWRAALFPGSDRNRSTLAPFPDALRPYEGAKRKRTGLSRTVRSQGWRRRAYMEVFTVCSGKTSPLPFCSFVRTRSCSHDWALGRHCGTICGPLNQ